MCIVGGICITICSAYKLRKAKKEYEKKVQGFRDNVREFKTGIKHAVTDFKNDVKEEVNKIKFYR
jgi:hypothetical protein